MTANKRLAKFTQLVHIAWLLKVVARCRTQRITSQMNNERLYQIFIDMPKLVIASIFIKLFGGWNYNR